MTSTQFSPEDRRLIRRVEERFRRGIKEFNLIARDDYLLVGLSGGKDSLALLHLLGEYRRHARHPFRLAALHVRTKGVDYRTDTDYLREMAECSGATFHLRTIAFEPDRDERRTPCFLCSWNRRKALFELAQELGCNKIALGHHQDDILHTALMNLSFNGSFSTMPVSLQMRKMPLHIIRPLCLENEADLRYWAALHDYRPLEKICPHDTASSRTEIKSVLTAFEQLTPDFRQNLWHALHKDGKLVEE